MVADCEKKNNQKSNEENMNDRKKNRPRGRPKVSGVCKLSKAVTVKFSKIDYERLCRRSRQANLTLAEFLRVSAFETTITARHSAEETAVIRSLTGMANNLNQLTRLSHQAGFHRTQKTVTELLQKLKEIIVRYRHGNIREITDSFNYQRELNPKIKQPVGHIALSFKPEDKALLTDEFMAKIAQEYMELMGIRNTQFILVRHHNTDNPHCHLVYNRIGYDGKVISSQSDYKRNEIATKLLKDKYGLTYAEDKGKTNVEKLHASERVKYEIFNAVKAALKCSGTWKEFNDYLLRRGIRLEFVKRVREIKRQEDIQGIRFTKDGQTFKASQISREFSFARLNARLGWKTSESRQESEHKVQQRIPDGGHLLESTGLGLFSPTNGTAPEEPLPQEELLRRRRKRQKRKGFGL